MPDCIFIDRYRQDMSLSALQLWLRSAVGERGKWSEGRREAPSETKPKRNGLPPSRRRKLTAVAAIRRMPTRDERADLRSGAGVVEGQRGDGQPVKRSKPRVGHGDFVFFYMGFRLAKHAVTTRAVSKTRLALRRVLAGFELRFGCCSYGSPLKPCCFLRFPLKSFVL